MTPNGTTTTTPKSTAYYQKGNEEVATETPLITRKLEKRRILTSKSERLVIVLVGLPARGKSFISRKLRNFLLWNGSQCKIFNVGKYRREATEDGKHGDANFFAASNNHAAQLRQQAAELALRDMLRWLDDGDNGTTPTNNDNDDDDAILRNPRMLTRGMSLINEPPEADRVAIFDATNSTDERRSWILNECSNHPTAVGVVFVESICDDEELLRENYQYKIKSSPDFEGMSPDEALEDLRARVKNYEEKYETITDDGQSYIKIFNLSTKLMVNHIYGRMAKTIVPAIMAWNVGTRPIFLCRAGETQNNNATAATTTTTPNNTPTTTTLHDLIPIPPLLDINSPDSTNNDDDAAAAEGWIQQHIMNSTIQQENLCHLGKQHPQGNHHRRSGSNRMTSSKKKNTKLGTKGIKFRDALEDYIEQEGTAFMRKQQTQQTHFDMDTGTSLSGLASYHLPQQQQPETTAGTTTTTTTDAAAAASEESRLDFCDNPTTNHSQAAVDEFPLVILTSTLPRAAETVMFQRHSYPLSTSPNLNPLDKGDYTGLELEEIRQVDPQWFEKLTNDPYFTRFPGGESYSDLITRLEPVIIDMEQQTAPVLLVSHISVLQTLIAYFREDTPTNECMGLEVPLHTVIKFTPSRGGGWVESRHSLLLQSQQQQQTKGDISSAASASSTTTLSAHSSSSSLLVMKTTAAEDDTSSPTATMHKSAEKISTPIWGDHLVINNASSSSL